LSEREREAERQIERGESQTEYTHTQKLGSIEIDDKQRDTTMKSKETDKEKRERRERK